MPKFAYVNGAYIPHTEAAVHIEDRGFQFADGVYEVVSCIHGNLADERGHFERLNRSLAEIGMEMPMPQETLKFVIRELLRRNRLRNAIVYIQVTRGATRRDFAFPRRGVRQSVVVTARPFRFENAEKMRSGVKVITVPDLRWKRRDIKSTALLPQVLAREAAVEKGAYEAWMVDDDGFVTEGAACNAWIVTRDGVLHTRKATHDILRGVTRTAIARLGEDLQIRCEEKSFTPAQAAEAAEAFMTNATGLVTPVTEIDGHKIGDGKPGKVTLRLYDEYLAYINGLRGGQIGWKP